MLEKLEITNFRCFENHEVQFNNFNVIVGKNNTGKSTIIDALMLVSNVCRYAPHRQDYLEDRDIPFPLISLRHNYVETDTTILAKFSDDTELEVVFPIDDRPHAEFSIDGNPINDRASLRNLLKHSLGVVPPVGTFEESEKLVGKKYLSSILLSHLTARHFRNIWHDFKDGFEEFQEIIENTWPGCTIEAPVLFNTNELYMLFRENGISREVFWAGHGFQVWLQLMTFLVKLGKVQTLVLDEPDIYLHSDMQKKLVNICKERSNQVIIATHAVDIIEEVDPEDIICVDKNASISRRLSNIDEVQTVIAQLGSLQNLKLVHFIRGRTCLFVEGKDFKYLKVIAAKLGYQSFAREDGFSVIPLEGFSNWDRLMHVNWIFTSAFGESVKCYVILDKDYYTQHETLAIVSSLQQKGVQAHVWERKEIENYAIEYDALYRMFTNKFHERYGNRKMPITAAQLREKIFSFFEEFKQHVLSQMIARETETKLDRTIHDSTIITRIMEKFERDWEGIEFRRKVVPGKDLFAKLNDWLNSEYHIAIPLSYAIFSLRRDEIATEVSDVISAFIELVTS